MARTLDEAQFTRQVVHAARYMGWRVVHFSAAQSARGRHMTPVVGDRGSPDLLMVHAGLACIIHAELKAPKGRLRPDQKLWLADLRAVADTTTHVRVVVWRPADWETIIATLRDPWRTP